MLRGRWRRYVELYYYHEEGNILTNIVYSRATGSRARLEEPPRGSGFLNHRELRYLARAVVV